MSFNAKADQPLSLLSTVLQRRLGKHCAIAMLRPSNFNMFRNISKEKKTYQKRENPI
jgi:hypothetical protein